MKLDPLTTGQLLADIEQAVAASDLMPYDQLLETRGLAPQYRDA